MWHMAGVAGTGVAIAGVGATYYALSRRDYELESRNRNLLETQTVAGCSKHSVWDNAEAGILERTYSSLFGMSSVDDKKSGPPHMTASQNFLKANFEALARGSGSVDGLNVAKNEIAPEEGFGALRIHRVASRAEIDSSMFEVDNNTRLHIGSRSDTTGYLRRREKVLSIPSGSDVNIIQPAPSPIVTTAQQDSSPKSLKSDSSRSVFDVETCSTYQFYSEEDITARASQPKLRASSTMQESSNSRPVVKEQIKPPNLSNRVVQRSMIPVMIKSKASVPKYPLRKSFPNKCGANSPYLKRAEPINSLHKQKQSKLTKSFSTAQNFSSHDQKCEHFQTVRSCGTSLGGFDLDKPGTVPSSPQKTALVTDLISTSEVGAATSSEDFISQVDQRGSVEILFPHNNLDLSDQSAAKKECNSDREVENENNVGQEEFSLESQLLNQKDVESFVKIVEQMEITTNELLKDSMDTETSDERAEEYNPNPGIMGGIPRDSWVMLPLRYLPSEMIPWSIVFFTPILVFMMGVSGYIFVSLTQYLFSDFEGVADITRMLQKK